jgi:transposase
VATSTNGFAFTASIDKAGESVTLVAHKDDHEGRKTEVFHFAPEQVSLLTTLLIGAVGTAKERRKAIRRAAKEAEAASPPATHPAEAER